MSSQSGGFADRSSSTVNSSSATTLAAQNIGRQYLFIQNLSAVVVYIRIGGSAAAVGVAGNIYLAANGGSVIWEGETFCPNGAISAISASASNNVVTVLEG